MKTNLFSAFSRSTILAIALLSGAPSLLNAQEFQQCQLNFSLYQVKVNSGSDCLAGDTYNLANNMLKVQDTANCLFNKTGQDPMLLSSNDLLWYSAACPSMVTIIEESDEPSSPYLSKRKTSCAYNGKTKTMIAIDPDGTAFTYYKNPSTLRTNINRVEGGAEFKHLSNGPFWTKFASNGEVIFERAVRNSIKPDLRH